MNLNNDDGKVKVSPEGIPEALFKYLSRYAQGIAESVDELTAETTDQLKKQIKADSPKRTGAYRRGWVSKTISEQRGNKTMLIYNRKRGLPHLLESGHKFNHFDRFKEPDGHIKGKPHIYDNVERTKEKYLKKVEEIIRNGGKA
jgi:hypothetical protein